jgi:branched-chain amino acid transport system substrate-binding protein
MRRSQFTSALAVLAAVVVLAGCTSTSDGGNATGTTGPAAPIDRCTGTPAAGEPIQLGTVTTLTAPTGTTQDYVDGMNAAIACVNAAGGLQGHPIALTVCDDKGDAATAKACTQSLVDKKVLAVVGGLSTTGAAEIYPVLETAMIPRIGYQPLTGPDFKSPMSFPLISGGGGYAAAAAKYLLDKTTVTKVAVVYANIDAGKATADLFDRVLHTGAGRGIDVKKVGIDIAAQDFGPVITALTTGFNPEVVLFASSNGQAPPFMRAAQQAGLSDKAVMIYPSSVARPKSLAAAGDAASGAVFFMDVYNPSVKEFQDNPATGVQLYTQIMAKYAPSVSVDSAQTLLGVGAILFLQDVVKRIGSGQLDPAALISTIKTLKDQPVVGIHSYTWAPGTGSQAIYPQVPNTFQTGSRYLGSGKWAFVSDMTNGLGG